MEHPDRCHVSFRHRIVAWLAVLANVIASGVTASHTPRASVRLLHVNTHVVDRDGSHNAASELVAGRGAENAVTYGPGKCVALWQNGHGHCAIGTKCKDHDIDNYPVKLICEKNGEKVRHVFAEGSFAAEEEFDTLISCSRCIAFVDESGAPEDALEEEPASAALNNLRSKLQNLTNGMVKQSRALQKLNAKVFNIKVEVEEEGAGEAVKGSASHDSLVDMTSRLDRDEESHLPLSCLTGCDSTDSNRSCLSMHQQAGDNALQMFKPVAEASVESAEETTDNASSDCSPARAPEGVNNKLFQEILASHLGKIERSLSDDLQKTLQLVAAHLKTVARQDVSPGELNMSNNRLYRARTHNGVSSPNSPLSPRGRRASRSETHMLQCLRDCDKILQPDRRNSLERFIPGMANVDTKICKTDMNGEAGHWRAVASEPNAGSSPKVRVSRGALKSPETQRSSRTSGNANVTFQATAKGSNGTSRQSESNENIASVKEETAGAPTYESESDLGSGSSSSSLGDKDANNTRPNRVSPKSPDLQFKVLAIWAKENVSLASAMSDSKTSIARASRRKSLRRMSTNLFADGDITEMSLEIRGSSRCSHIVLHPNSITRACWDAISFCLIVYDVVAIPFQLFEPPDHEFLLFMAWLTRFFWTSDVFASLNTGFVLKSSGNTEMRHSEIAKRYLRTWCALDLLLVGVDWLELLWSGTGSLGFARIGKATRAFRILRMLRVLRMRQAVNLLIDRVRSERLMVVADIAKIMLVIIGFAHISACFWYGIGASRTEERTWVKEGSFTEESLGYRYMTSLHWSLSQFSGGMDEVKPYNNEERTYCVFVFIVAFLMAAVLTSSLTSSMTRLHMLSTRQSQQLSVLRRFLSDNGVSRGLVARVQRNANHAMMEQQRYQQESNVELLKVISGPLKMELHFEMYSPVLTKHPFFSSYSSECPHVMRKVCHRSTSMSLVSSNDIIFNAGEVPMNPKMSFVCNGSLSYFSMTDQEFLVKEGDWISEGVLWTPWMHRGSLRANGDCRLCELDAKSFQDIVGQFDHGEFDPKDYAAHFVRKLNAHKGEVTDLHVQFLEEPDAPKLRQRRGSLGSLDKVRDGAQTLVDSCEQIVDVAQTFVRRMSGERRASNPFALALSSTSSQLREITPAATGTGGLPVIPRPEYPMSPSSVGSPVMSTVTMND